MKWALIVLVALVAIFVIMYVIGKILPQHHTAEHSETIPISREELWKLITNFKEWPSWRSDLKKITMTGERTFTEVTSHSDTIDYAITTMEPAKQLVTTIATENLPYGGSWTYLLTDDGTGCKLTITENGEVYNPIFRFLSRFVFGHHATLRTFFKDLNKKVSNPGATK